MRLNELRELLIPALQGTRFAAKARFAGGCVRDFLLDPQCEVRDADISVELPSGGILLAEFIHESLPASPPELHPDFGTASCVFEGVQLDFAMTRAERYHPGSRHPRVRFASLQTDCLRRDFTVNALYQDIVGGETIDPCGHGFDDLRAKTIRSLRDPLLSFSEDPLRLLRALRFAAVLGFRIEDNALKAARECAPLVASLSMKRREDELLRLQSSADASGLIVWRDLCGYLKLDAYLKLDLSPLGV